MKGREGGTGRKELPCALPHPCCHVCTLTTLTGPCVPSLTRMAFHIHIHTPSLIPPMPSATHRIPHGHSHTSFSTHTVPPHTIPHLHSTSHTLRSSPRHPSRPVPSFTPLSDPYSIFSTQPMQPSHAHDLTLWHLSYTLMTPTLLSGSTLPTHVPPDLYGTSSMPPFILPDP